MNESYNTKQKELLLKFLSTHHDKIFTVSQIVDALKNEGISKSSVYRNLDILLNNNLIKNVVIGKSKTINYQFISEHCKGVVHLCCSICDKMIHLNDDVSELIYKKYNFTLDKDKTIIYGLCADCKW